MSNQLQQYQNDQTSAAGALELPPLETDLSTYYRSRVFNAKSGINTLITNAQPVIALLTRLNNTQNTLDGDQLKENLVHELKTFEARSLSDNYQEDQVMLARYIITTQICTALQDKTWENSNSALENAFPEISKAQHVDTVLHQISREPTKYIDLIELAYVCLSLSEVKTASLENRVNELYHIIAQHRGDKQPSFMLTPKKKHQQKKTGMSFQFAILIAVLMAVVCYFSFFYILELNTTLVPDGFIQSSEMADLSNENI